jgi:hypothetical protein
MDRPSVSGVNTRASTKEKTDPLAAYPRATRSLTVKACQSHEHSDFARLQESWREQPQQHVTEREEAPAERRRCRTRPVRLDLDCIDDARPHVEPLTTASSVSPQSISYLIVFHIRSDEDVDQGDGGPFDGGLVVHSVNRETANDDCGSAGIGI